MVDFNNKRKTIFIRIFKNKKLLFLLLLILVGGFLRLYRLKELMTYLGDEGRDMLIVADIIQGKNFPFIGPPTSIGKLYLGPIYYYLITPFAWIFKMSPIGPAVFVVLLGLLTILLIYLVGSKYFNEKTGLFAAGLYTVSPLIVKFSRSSWNPNPMPFFSLVFLLSLYYWQEKKQSKYLFFAIIAFAIMLQLHYMAILLTPFLVFVFFKIGTKQQNKKTIIISSLIFILLLSPLLIFDLKHNFVNTKGIIEIFQQRSGEGFNFFEVLSRARDRIRQLFSLFLGFSEREWRNNLVVILTVLYVFINWFKQKKITRLIIYGWFMWGLLTIGLYRGSVYPHYLGFLFIMPALLMGHLLDAIYQFNTKTKILGLIFFLLLETWMLKITWKDLSRPPVLNVNLVQKIVKLIGEESNGKDFNFALLAKNNYDDSYRYFFRLWNLPVSYQTKVTQQLFVVCEDADICFPQGNPKWEIALFDVAYNGDIKIAGEWTPDPLIKVFKFIANKEVSL